MKFAPLLTLFAASAACALIFVCFFGGYSTSTLTNVYMLSFNTSQLSDTRLDSNTSTQGGGLQFQNGRVTANGSNYPRDEPSSPTSSKNLDLYEYYAVFAITYCEGEYVPTYQGGDVSLALSRCRSPSLTRRFNLIQIVKDALEELQYNANGLDWPEGLSDSFQYFESAQTAMVILSVAGVAFSLLLTAVALLAICVSCRWIRMVLFVLSMLACISLAVAAGVSTAMINSVTNAFGASGDLIGISAQSGNLYLGLIWTAVALLFLSTLIVMARVCIPDQDRHYRRRRGFGPRYDRYMMMPDMQDQWYGGTPRGQFGQFGQWYGEEEEDFR